MEWAIQWFFVILSLGVFLYWIKNPPFRDWALVFFFSGYLSIFIAVILVEEKWFAFPVRFLSDYFSTSVVYEFLFIPTVSVLYNLTAYRSEISGATAQAVVYSAVLTLVEFWFLKATELITYYRWTLLHTFVTIMVFLVCTRYLLRLLREPDPTTMRS